MLVNGVTKNSSQVKIKEQSVMECPLDQFIPTLRPLVTFLVLDIIGTNEWY
jgi:hypothetical protein